MAEIRQKRSRPERSAKPDQALKIINKQRADLGGYQNRFEMAKIAIDIAAENMQAAESVLRDTDMASQLVEYVKDTILVHSGTAMLAQANQQTETKNAPGAVAAKAAAAQRPGRADIVLDRLDLSGSPGRAGEIRPLGKADDDDEERHGKPGQALPAKAGTEQRERDDGDRGQDDIHQKWPHMIIISFVTYSMKKIYYEKLCPIMYKCLSFSIPCNSGSRI